MSAEEKSHFCDDSFKRLFDRITREIFKLSPPPRLVEAFIPSFPLRCLAGMDSSQRLKELFSRYQRRDIEPAEMEEMVLLLGQADGEDALSGPMLKLWEDLKAKPVEYPVDWDRMNRRVSDAASRSSLLRRIDWQVAGWRALTAAFLLMAAMAAYWSVTWRRHPVVTAQKVTVQPVIAGKPVEINYDDITMEEALRQIGQRFHTSVVFVNPALKRCRVTATIYREDDLHRILTVICKVNRSNFVIKGDIVTIDGEGCN